MGLFQHRPEEEENQWTLPSEPLDRSEAEVLSTAPVADPLSLGLASGASISSIVFPVAVPAPEATSQEDRDPQKDRDPQD